MKPSLLQYAAAWVPLVPVLAAVGAGPRTTAARRWVAVWCLLLVAQDAIAIALGARGLNNLWITYVFTPIITGVLLWALARWHPDHAARLGLRAAVPLVVLVSIVLTLTIDDARSFSLVVAPFHSIVMLLGTIWTFVGLSFRSSDSIVREDWFWVIGGVMLYAAMTTAIQPLSWYLLRDRVDLLHATYNVRAAIILASFAAITWGMLSRGMPTFSGGSSSPPSSPSSSSSGDSRLRW